MDLLIGISIKVFIIWLCGILPVTIFGLYDDWRDGKDITLEALLGYFILFGLFWPFVLILVFSEEELGKETLIKGKGK